jgi:tripartite-type tricarboxylate transporter receptor subunit TctC
MMRSALFALILAPALAALPAAAQEKINKPVRMVVGFAAGGSVDRVARVIGERLSPRLGQPVLIENKPGGFVRWRPIVQQAGFRLD